LEIQAECINRMRVFDAAPKHLRDKANEISDAALTSWFDGLQEQQQRAVLNGKPLPDRTPDRVDSIMDIFWKRF
jgi:hypothetical protein